MRLEKTDFWIDNITKDLTGRKFWQDFFLIMFFYVIFNMGCEELDNSTSTLIIIII